MSSTKTHGPGRPQHNAERGDHTEARQQRARAETSERADIRSNAERVRRVSEQALGLGRTAKDQSQREARQ